jgi:DNA-binding MarR family transcriptional regulator
VSGRTSPPGREGPAELQPTAQELRISARLLLHLERQPRTAPSEIPPDSMTQAGMARALGTSQAAVSNALNRLVDGGAVWVEKSHVRERFVRLKVYHLTSLGEELARELRQRFGL